MGSNGAHFTLSYHVDERDNMRCYFYFAGQCARFLTEDIVLVLPLFFESTDSNMGFVETKEALFIIKKMRKTLKDSAFRKFLEAHKVTYISKELEAKLAATDEQS